MFVFADVSFVVCCDGFAAVDIVLSNVALIIHLFLIEPIGVHVKSVILVLSEFLSTLTSDGFVSYDAVVVYTIIVCFNVSNT